MRTHPSVIHLPFFLFLVVATPGFSQASPKERLSDSDSASFFLYVDYCGSRYNKSIRQPELVINAIKLPAYLLKKMPRLKGDGLYSSKNRRILMKQQEIVRKFHGDKMTVRVNKKQFRAFYPRGLKKGIIIESDEFNRWNFLEKPVPALPPVIDPDHNWYYWEWHRTDPVNIQYGLMIDS